MACRWMSDGGVADRPQAPGRRVTTYVLVLSQVCLAALSTHSAADAVVTTQQPLIDASSGEVHPVDPWRGVRDAVEAFVVEDMVLVVGNRDGERLNLRKGQFRDDLEYPIASATKWLSAAAIVSLVEEGVLGLGDNPQDWLPWWTSDPTDPRSRVTLEQLLSMTSGFDVANLDEDCLGDSSATLEACARELYEQGFGFEPGTTFSYGPPHFQVAAAMAQAATEAPFAVVFRNQLATPLGMAQTNLRRPSASNPRVAGGATSSARDYARFLHALLTSEYLAKSFDTLFADRTDDPVVIDLRPDVIDANNADFHYALGNWRECYQPVWDAQCVPLGVVSSPGAFGWYPWIDFGAGYYALIAMREFNGGEPSGTVLATELATTLRPMLTTIFGAPPD